MDQVTPQDPTPKFLTIPQFAAKHPWATIGGLRWQRFHGSTNGYARAFISIGRKVVIDEREYFRIVERLNDPLIGDSNEST